MTGGRLCPSRSGRPGGALAATADSVTARCHQAPTRAHVAAVGAAFLCGAACVSGSYLVDLLDLERAAPVAKGTVGIRLPITRFQCKVKMGQDKDPETQGRVIQALRAPGAYHNPGLADEMERALAGG